MPSLDLGTVLTALAPFAAFALILVWGVRRRKNRKMAMEMAYNMIALELLLFLLLPICEQPFDCGWWASILIFMFGALVAFYYHHLSRDARHVMRLIEAIKAGHIGEVELVRARPGSRREPETDEESPSGKAAGERGGKSASGGEDRKKSSYKKSRKRKGGKSGRKAKKKNNSESGKAPGQGGGPSKRAERPDHEKIEEIIHSVLEKAKGKPEKKPKSAAKKRRKKGAAKKS